MKKTVSAIIIIICIIGTIVMCQQNNSNQIDVVLNKAENLMQEHPDSAFNLLQNLPKPQNLRNKQQALYALLYTQAQYKNNIPVKNDSLLNIANVYFSSSTDSIHKAWTYFYMAQLYRDTGNIQKALIYFQKANTSINKLNNVHLMHILYFHWGCLLQKQKPYEESIAKFSKALQYAIQTKDTLGQIYTIGELGWLYTWNHNYQEAQIVLNKGIKLAQKGEEGYLKSWLLHCLSFSYFMNHQPKLALKFINECLKLNQDTTSLYSIWQTKGDIFMNLERYDSAQYYFAKDNRYTTLYEKAAFHNVWAKYEERTGNYPKALEHRKLYETFLDSIHNQEANENLMELQKKYDFSLVKLENNNLKIKQQNLYLTFLFIIILIIIIAGFIAYYINKRFDEKKEVLRSITDLNKQIRLELQEKTINLQSSKNKESELINELMEKTEIIKYQISQEEQLRQEILQSSSAYQKIKQLGVIEQWEKATTSFILTNQELDNLVEYTNLCYNHFTERLLKDFPNLNTKDLYLCCLIKMSTPPQNILYLLNITKDNLKKRKTRIKREKMNFDETISFDDFIKDY